MTDYFYNTDKIIQISIFKWCLLFTLLYFYILTPYFVFSSNVIHSGFVSVLAMILCYIYFVRRHIVRVKLVVFSAFLLFFAAFHFLGHALYRTDGVFEFLNYLMQVFIYVFFGYMLGALLKFWGFTYEGAFRIVMLLSVCVAFANSVIIIIEYFFSEFRGAVESLLYLPENSNIDYRNRSFRFRGLAAGGAANLSLFFGLMIVATVHLFVVRTLSFISLVVIFCVIVVSMLFVGRTGLLIAGVGSFFVLISHLIPHRGNVSTRAFFAFGLIAFSIILMPLVASYFLPQNLLEYSLGFYYEGIEGLKEEGTVSIVLNMFAFPDSLGGFLTGIGNFSGSFLSGISADSGYMKSFTALGFVISLAFYIFVCVFVYNARPHGGEKVFLMIILLMFLISEIKEPFILKGYSARLLWLVVGMRFIFDSKKLIMDRVANKSVDSK